MEIKTKFNVGDKVYTIDPKTLKIREIEVGGIYVYADGTENLIKYRAKGDSPFGDSYNESVCFATRQLLLDYISE